MVSIVFTISFIKPSAFLFSRFCLWCTNKMWVSFNNAPILTSNSSFFVCLMDGSRRWRRGNRNPPDCLIRVWCLCFRLVILSDNSLITFVWVFDFSYLEDDKGMFPFKTLKAVLHRVWIKSGQSFKGVFLLWCNWRSWRPCPSTCL